MNFLPILGIAVALAMDAFAVSVSAGVSLRRPSRRQYFRLAFHFGLFQSLMPIVGWSAGRAIEPLISRYDHWLAFALLSAVGLKMILDSFEQRRAGIKSDPTRGFTLLMLAVATSVDALAVGLSFALLGVSVWLPALVIGLVCAALTVIGLKAGTLTGRALGRRAELLGGAILLLIGAKILLSHLA